MKKFFWLLIASMACNAAYFHVASDGTGTSAQGGTWAQAINADTLEKVLENTIAAGDMVFIKDGAYTIGTLDCSARDATAADPISLIGVKTGTTHEGAAVTFADWSSDTTASTNIPVITCGGTAFSIGDYYHLHNLSITSANNYTVQSGTYTTAYNCEFINTYSSSNNSKYAFYGGSYGKYKFCTFKTTKVNGLSLASNGRAVDCIFMDMSDATGGKAITCGVGSVIIRCKFLHNNVAILMNSYSTVENCTFFGNTTDVSGTTYAGCLIENNIHDSTKTDAYVWTTQTNNNFFFANHGNDTRCADMWDGVEASALYKDHFVTTGDPKFANPPDSLQLDADSPCLNTGTGLK